MSYTELRLIDPRIIDPPLNRAKSPVPKFYVIKILRLIGVWINQFLTNRIQYVIVNGEKSEIAHVRSGVPQGTVLGPVLFIIMISDIGTNIRNHISLYADDSPVIR